MQGTDVEHATSGSSSLDWTDWLRRWDAQQEGYLPFREARFTIMLDVLADLLPEEFTVLDLACGPGAISQRVLRRFPKARTIALDTDPVLLAMGQGAIGDGDGRIVWLKDDLTDPDWITRLEAAIGNRRLDAVLSSTALHWLAGDVLTRVYHQLGILIRPGGLIMNADHMAFAPSEPTFTRLADANNTRIQHEAFAVRGVEDWDSWWAALAREPSIQGLLAEREQRFGWRDRVWIRPSLDLQVGALRDAGFSEVGVIWQELQNRILLAIR